MIIFRNNPEGEAELESLLNKGKRQIKQIHSDFKEFVGKGSVLDLAIGVIVGEAFGSVVSSFVGDIFTPIISLIVYNELSETFIVIKKGEHYPYNTRREAIQDGAITWNYGNFIQLLINFFLVAGSLFIVIKMFGSMRKKRIETHSIRECPFCFTDIDPRANKCRHCTADLPPSNDNNNDNKLETITVAPPTEDESDDVPSGFGSFDDPVSHSDGI